jgi:hypothetical protein
MIREKQLFHLLVVIIIVIKTKKKKIDAGFNK